MNQDSTSIYASSANQPLMRQQEEDIIISNTPPSSEFDEIKYNWPPVYLQNLSSDLRQEISFTPFADAADPTQPCKCFEAALENVQQLTRYITDPDSYGIDSHFHVGSQAIKVCELFLNCKTLCHHTHLLLYITVMQQIETHYCSLANRLKIACANSHIFDMGLRIGSFEIKAAGLNWDVSKAILAAERMTAAGCALRMGELVDNLVQEQGCEKHELKCQKNILSSIANSFCREITD